MGTRILIAEDEPFIVESLSFLLKREGYDVEAVDTGSRALAVLQASAPDLLLLDIMLPETNGFDVLRRVRASEALAGLPVMVLTAKGQEADRKRMQELGADDFVTKPFSNRDLIERVAVLLREAAKPPG
ncbi:MAG: response regulator [Marivibrio sp.]|uniref:response regulator transcription factor n=1 Tax=Marivibrio sp. TaxID=2039719 RepID=UPI0032EB9F4F